MRYHFTPTRLVIMKKKKDPNKDVKELEPSHIAIGNVKGYSHCGKQVWQFLKKLNKELPYDLSNLLIGIYPREMKTGVQTEICTQIFIATLFIIAKK